MARKASIFLNLNEYLIHVPEEQRYHLDEVEDINFQPYSFKNRLKKLSEDVEYQSSVSTDIRSLFIALNLRIKDLDTADLPDQFRRLRIGVGRPPARIQVADFVLGRFTEIEEKQLQGILDNAAETAIQYICN